MLIEQRSKYYMRPWPGSNNNLRYPFYKHLMPLASGFFKFDVCKIVAKRLIQQGFMMVLTQFSINVENEKKKVFGLSAASFRLKFKSCISAPQ